MLTCDACRAHLNDYVYGEASFYLKAQIEEHLASCPACREEAAFLRQIRDTLSDMPKIEVDAGFKAALNQRLDQLEQAAPVKKRKFYKDWCAYSALAACVVLAVVLQTNVFEFGKQIEQNGLDDRQAIANVDVTQLVPVTPEAQGASDVAASEPEPTAKAQESAAPEATKTPAARKTAQPQKTVAPKPTVQPEESPKVQSRETVETSTPPAQAADAPQETVQAADIAADEQMADRAEAMQQEDAGVYETEAPQQNSLKSAAQNATEEPLPAGETRGGGSGGGASALSEAAPYSAAPEKTQGSGTLYVDAEHIGKAREIAGSYGTHSGNTVEMTRAQLKRYFNALYEQGVEYQSGISDGDTVQFEIVAQ